MPGIESVEKMRVSLLIKISTIEKVDKAATIMHLSRNEVAGIMLERAAEAMHISLTDADWDKVNKKVQENKNARKS